MPTVEFHSLPGSGLETAKLQERRIILSANLSEMEAFGQFQCLDCETVLETRKAYIQHVMEMCMSHYAEVSGIMTKPYHLDWNTTAEKLFQSYLEKIFPKGTLCQDAFATLRIQHAIYDIHGLRVIATDKVSLYRCHLMSHCLCN